MIIFKRKKFRLEFEGLDRRLQHIVFDLAGVMKYETGKDLIITSVWRNEPKGTHFYRRALDYRISTAMGKHFTDEEVEFMKQWCKDYKYGGDKPTLYVHKNRLGKGKHGHLQVSSKNWTILSNA